MLIKPQFVKDDNGVYIIPTIGYTHLYLIVKDKKGNILETKDFSYNVKSINEHATIDNGDILRYSLTTQHFSQETPTENNNVFGFPNTNKLFQNSTFIKKGYYSLGVIDSRYALSQSTLSLGFRNINGGTIIDVHNKPVIHTLPDRNNQQYNFYLDREFDCKRFVIGYGNIFIYENLTNYLDVYLCNSLDITEYYNELENKYQNCIVEYYMGEKFDDRILEEETERQTFEINKDIEIVFYKNGAENNRVDKTPFLDEVLRIKGKFRNEVSKISPSFEFEYNGYIEANYCYISVFNRYYYIDDMTAIRTNYWGIDCSCDTLMSFKNEILNIDAFISRNEYQSSPEIPDENFTCNIKRDIKYSEIEQSGSFYYSFSGDVKYLRRAEDGTLEVYYSLESSYVPEENRYTGYLKAYEPLFNENRLVIGFNFEKPIKELDVFYDYFKQTFTYANPTGVIDGHNIYYVNYYALDPVEITEENYSKTLTFDRNFYQQFDIPKYFEDLDPNTDEFDKGLKYKVLSQNYVILVSGRSNIATYYQDENVKGGLAPISNSLRALIVNQPTLTKILSKVYSETFAENKSLLFQTLNGTIQGIFAYPFTVLGDPPFIYSVETGSNTTLKLGLADITIDNDFYISVYDIPQETKEFNAFINYDYDFSKIGNNINGYIQIIKSDYFTIDREFNNYLDYNPYTSYSLYLPYFGTYEMKINDIIDKQIRIIYAVNILTKQANIYITANDKLYDVIECEIGFDIPFSESNRNEQKRNLLFSAVSAGIGALTKGAVKGVQLSAEKEPRVLTPKTKVESALHKQWRKEQTADKISASISGIGSVSGTAINNLPSFATTGEAKVSGMLSLLDPSKFYLIKYIPDPIVKGENIAHYNRLIGQPYFAYARLGDMRGFTVVSAIHLENISTAMTEEKDDIEERLLAGVLLPE